MKPEEALKKANVDIITGLSEDGFIEDDLASVVLAMKIYAKSWMERVIAKVNNPNYDNIHIKEFLKMIEND